MNDETREGGCLCGSIRYRISGAPRSSSVCFCRSCRLSSGAPSVGWFAVDIDRFEWLAGQPKQHRSSAPVTRGFCAGCGTSLTYLHDDSPGRIELTTATLDHPEALPPTREIWFSQKVPWAASDPAVRHWPEDSDEA